MREALIVFSPLNDHPFGWLLNKEHRHVFVLVKDRNNYWVSYEWALGNVFIHTECGENFDIATMYSKFEGYHVIPFQIDDGVRVRSTFILNNCVGHSKALCGIRAMFAFTPHGLYNYLTKGSVMYRLKIKLFSFFRFLTYIPGGGIFGGGGGGSSPPPPPPPPEIPDPPKATDPEVKRSRIGERKRQALAGGRRKNKRDGQIVDDPENQPKKTLLGL